MGLGQVLAIALLRLPFLLMMSFSRSMNESFFLSSIWYRVLTSPIENECLCMIQRGFTKLSKKYIRLKRRGSSASKDLVYSRNIFHQSIQISYEVICSLYREISSCENRLTTLLDEQKELLVLAATFVDKRLE